MDVFQFAALPVRANDSTRRYRISREEENVGEIDLGGDAPDGDVLLMTVTCQPTLSDATRDGRFQTRLGYQVVCSNP